MAARLMRCTNRASESNDVVTAVSRRTRLRGKIEHTYEHRLSLFPDVNTVPSVECWRHLTDYRR